MGGLKGGAPRGTKESQWAWEGNQLEHCGHPVKEGAGVEGKAVSAVGLVLLSSSRGTWSQWDLAVLNPSSATYFLGDWEKGDPVQASVSN